MELEQAVFLNTIWSYVKDECCPKSWRKGQAVFNATEQLYGVARDVQFLDGVDCFYDDDAISKFLDCAWERYKIKNEGKREV